VRSAAPAWFGGALRSEGRSVPEDVFVQRDPEGMIARRRPLAVIAGKELFIQRVEMVGDHVLSERIDLVEAYVRIVRQAIGEERQRASSDLGVGRQSYYLERRHEMIGEPSGLVREVLVKTAVANLPEEGLDGEERDLLFRKRPLSMSRPPIVYSIEDQVAGRLSIKPGDLFELPGSQERPCRGNLSRRCRLAGGAEVRGPRRLRHSAPDTADRASSAWRAETAVLCGRDLSDHSSAGSAFGHCSTILHRTELRPAPPNGSVDQWRHPARSGG
jgi:hypothetical protein